MSREMFPRANGGITYGMFEEKLDSPAVRDLDGFSLFFRIKLDTVLGPGESLLKLDCTGNKKQLRVVQYPYTKAVLQDDIAYDHMLQYTSCTAR